MNKNDQSQLINYYSQRATEYEKIYSKPERHEDLVTLRKLLQNILAGHKVLEVACGTGFWTQSIAETAQSITATDISEEVLNIARSKIFLKQNVDFKKLDAYKINVISDQFSAGFAGFWWSHIPRKQITTFISSFHKAMSPNALIVFIDNLFVEGSSSPISDVDSDGNTYQLRTLENGTKHNVLKNFPTKSDLQNSVESLLVRQIRYETLKYYWCFYYYL